MKLFPLIVLPIFYSSARADDGSSWSIGQICGLIVGGIFVGGLCGALGFFSQLILFRCVAFLLLFIVAVVIACLVYLRAWICPNRGKMFSSVHEPSPPALVMAQPPHPQSSSPRLPSFSSRYLPPVDTVGSLYIVQDVPYSQAESKSACYPSLSGYIHENPMTISQSYSCQAERSNPVMALGKKSKSVIVFRCAV